jgi:hypothetical protein
MMVPGARDPKYRIPSARTDDVNNCGDEPVRRLNQSPMGGSLLEGSSGHTWLVWWCIPSEIYGILTASELLIQLRC